MAKPRKGCITSLANLTYMLHAAGQVEVYSISGSQEEQGDNVDNESKIKLLCGVWDEPVLICFRRMPPEPNK